ncbi:MAG: recombination protein RecR [Patescibacteria group bacterium]|nr:MAG: recombination protein RecR [Patescibacteria group bacterium]
MFSLPTNLKKIALFLERLPGIGQKTANRLAFFFLRLPEEDLQEFAENIRTLKQRTKLCQQCFNLTENNLCDICLDKNRDQTTVAVVETVIDLLSFENGNIYNGVYHVLHGKIDPLNHVGPDDLKVDELIKRIKDNNYQVESKIKEIILATSPDMEGEATAIYIKDQIKKIDENLKITRLAYGLPIGANLEYADYMTLKKALEGRGKL